MEVKLEKITSEDYQTLYKHYLKEMEGNGSYGQVSSFYDKNDDKFAVIFYENDIPLGFISFKYDFFNLVSSHMDVDPTKRQIGIEESMIKVWENLYDKAIHILVLNNDSYIMNLLKGLGYFRSSTKGLGSIKKFFDMYTKDDTYSYKKLIINLTSLYDREAKLDEASKRILKLYGVKPNKDNLRAFKNSIKQIEGKYLRKEINEEEFFKDRFQKYFRQYDIRIDPTLCHRIYSSSKIGLKPGVKKFLKTIGKRKHIYIISNLKPDDLDDVIKTLNLKNISNIYNLPINYESIKKIIKNNKYTDIMEYCYIDSSLISLDMLRAGIDTILVSTSLDKNNKFFFKKQAMNYKELSKIIIKK